MWPTFQETTRRNPSQDLKLPAGYGYQCIADAGSGQRCCNPISKRNRDLADTLLHGITADMPHNTLQYLLHSLAPLLLCKRDHKSYSGRVADDWIRRVETLNQYGLPATTTTTAAIGKIPLFRILPQPPNTGQNPHPPTTLESW
jgi:hypothetical protein